LFLDLKNFTLQKKKRFKEFYVTCEAHCSVPSQENGPGAMAQGTLWIQKDVILFSIKKKWLKLKKNMEQSISLHRSGAGAMAAGLTVSLAASVCILPMFNIKSMQRRRMLEEDAMVLLKKLKRETLWEPVSVRRKEKWKKNLDIWIGYFKRWQ
jgi:hypothetical protein